MEIKDRILHHAQTLFMRNGIKSVSMDDIAADMAISKKTLYKWFENKDEIVLATTNRHLHDTQNECARLMTTAGSAIEGLFRMMEWMKHQFTNVHPSIFYDLQKFHLAAWQLWMAHKHDFILTQITANLRRGIAEGLFRADLDVDVLARLRLAQIEMMFDQQLFPPRQFDLQRISVVFIEHFMLGIASPQGHELINQYRQVAEKK